MIHVLLLRTAFEFVWRKLFYADCCAVTFEMVRSNRISIYPIYWNQYNLIELNKAGELGRITFFLLSDKCIVICGEYKKDRRKNKVILLLLIYAYI